MTRRATRYIVLFCCLLPVLFAVVPRAFADPSASLSLDDLRRVFEEGNTLYEAGDYDEAIIEYTELVNAGAADKGLFYNLANAYYKTGDLGRAVLFYERARRMTPRDQDVRENLSLVRSQLRDEQFIREQNRFVRGLVWFHHNLNAGEMTLFASCCYFVLCLLGIIFLFRDSKVVSVVYDRISIVSPGRLIGLGRSQDIILAIVVFSFLFLSGGFSAWKKIEKETRRDEAVVVSREVPVFSSPTEDTTLQFKIHEGTVVRTREFRREWTRITLPGGLSGWVSTASVERI
jgi:hypothetical protein